MCAQAARNAIREQIGETALDALIKSAREVPLDQAVRHELGTGRHTRLINQASARITAAMQPVRSAVLPGAQVADRGRSLARWPWFRICEATRMAAPSESVNTGRRSDFQ